MDYDLSATIGASGGSIGRSAGNDLALPDTEGFVSRVHAKIESDGEKFSITDCSSNGTLILEPIADDSEDAFNEVFIHADNRVLIDGDYIVIGEFEIQVQYCGDSNKSADTTDFSEPAKVDTTLSKKNELNEKEFKPPVFTNTADVEQSAESFEFESSANVSVMQESFSIPEAKEDIKTEKEIPEAFNIDDFFADDNNGFEHNTVEKEEDDILDGLQNPFVDEENKEQATSLETDQLQIEVPAEIPAVINALNTTDADALSDVQDSIDIKPKESMSDVSENHDLAESEVNQSRSPLLADNETTGKPADLAMSKQPGQIAKKQANSDAFFNGLGIDISDLPPDEKVLEQILLNAGNILRALLEANMSLLKARTDLKREFSSSLTVVQKEENNPLKFCQTVDEVLPYLFYQDSPGFLSGPLAIKESSHDLCTHQMAMMAGIQAALEGTIKKFDPGSVERACEAGHFNKASKYWEFYESSYKTLSKDAQADFFGSDFASAYESQVNALKKK